MEGADATAPGKLAAILSRHPAGDATDLVDLLQDIQEELNYLPADAIRAAAAHLGIPGTRAFSVATFYKAFSLKPRGRTIVKVCLGTTCHIRGASVVVDDIRTGIGVGPGQTTQDMAFTVEVVNCVGACALAPVVIAGGRYLANVKPGTITRLLEAG